VSERQEFSKKVRLAAWDRCGGHCEGCTAKLYPGKFTYDHIIPDWMGGEPTLENCQVICSACDKPKTAKDQGDIAKAKRIRAKHAGIRKPSRFPCSRDSRWKKRMDGTVVERER
jgi:5-methylcytosine-specific restriction protein A